MQAVEYLPGSPRVDHRGYQSALLRGLSVSQATFKAPHQSPVDWSQRGWSQGWGGRQANRMTLTQRLDIKEGEHTLGFEELQ